MKLAPTRKLALPITCMALWGLILYIGYNGYAGMAQQSAPVPPDPRQALNLLVAPAAFIVLNLGLLLVARRMSIVVPLILFPFQAIAALVVIALAAGDL